MHFPTPHAAAAIRAQMEQRSDLQFEFDDVTAVGGAYIDPRWQFVAHFTTDWSGPFSDYPGDADYHEARCALVGAWAFDPDTDTITFAGNRDELTAFIGLPEVTRWEAYASERAQEDGPDDGGDQAYDLEDAA